MESELPDQSFLVDVKAIVLEHVDHIKQETEKLNFYEVSEYLSLLPLDKLELQIFVVEVKCVR